MRVRNFDRFGSWMATITVCAGTLQANAAAINPASALAVASGSRASLVTARSLAPAARGTKRVLAAGVSMNVPSSWPVLDYRAAATGCVRLDRHAVYIGEPIRSNCPARLVGSAASVRILATSPVTHGAFMRNAQGLPFYGGNPVDGAITFPAAADHAAVVISMGPDRPVAQAVAASMGLSSTPGIALTSKAAEPRTVAGRAVAPRSAASFTGPGFDVCTAPSTSDLHAWSGSASPYRAVNIYLGGANRACSQPNLTADWVSTVTGQGWKLIPTYVGRQAPCNSFGASISPPSAAAQGAASADEAVQELTDLALGLGNPIYFDMESYDRNNAGCVQAVERFLDAWTAELHNRGYPSGVYSSAYSGMYNLTQQAGNRAFHLPDVIWFADWNNNPSVWGDPYFDTKNQYWTNHQRIHQYQGGHNETHGGVTLNIDNDSVDAPTAPNGSGAFPTVDVFQPVPTARIFGPGQPPVAAGADRDISVLGKGGVPTSNVDAVVVNVEVFGPTSGGYLRVNPTGSPSSTAVQEFRAGQAISNLVTVKVSPAGMITLHLSAGAAYVLVDVAGYYANATSGTGDLFHSVPAARIFGTGEPPLVAGADRDIMVVGVGSVPTSNVDAVVVNVEVFGPTSGGYLRVTPTGSPSSTAVQEFAAGQAISNLVTVKVGPLGTITMHLSAGAAYVFVDVAGYYSNPSDTSGDRFHSLPMARVYGQGAPVLVAGADRDITVLGVAGVPVSNVHAVVVNVEVAGATGAGYLRVTPTGSPSGTAVQEFGAGQAISNLVTVKVGPSGTITLHLSANEVQVYVDVAGYFG